MSLNFCPQCGAPLSPDAKFCPSCGANVVQMPTMQPAADVSEPQPAAPSHAQEGDAAPVRLTAYHADRSQLTGWRSLVASIMSVCSFLPFMGWTARNCCILDGRLNRSPFFINSILLSLVGVLYNIFGFVLGAVVTYFFPHNMDLGTGAWLLFSFAMMIPLLPANLLLQRARLHDLDQSGWLVLLNLIPVVNFLYLIYVYCFSGTNGRNRFGQDPLLPQW